MKAGEGLWKHKDSKQTCIDVIWDTVYEQCLLTIVHQQQLVVLAQL